MKSTYKHIALTIIFTLAVFIHYSAAQNEIEATPFDGIESSELFASDEILELTLKADFTAITNDVGEDPQYHKAVIEYTDSYGQVQTMPLKVKARGHFRKNPCNCSFPPLKLNFKKKLTDDTQFDGQNKIKLVTHCNERRDIFEQYVLQEYLVYKSFNLLTENSFRARLARITYVDENGAMEPMQRFAFFIESVNELEDRLGGTEIEVNNIHDERTNFDAITLLSVFQYMIGNTDWSVPNLHNVKLISETPTSPPIVIPYDFDWSGMVNTHYAEPAVMFDLTSVRDRVFRGYTRTEEQLNEVFELFFAQKESIYSLYENCEYLDERQKKQSISYLDDFYKIISKERAVKYVFIKNARSSNISQR